MDLFPIVYRRVKTLCSNSRFNKFNSRLDQCEFPFKAQRELARNGLIWPAVFGAITALIRQNRKNSLFYGKNREPGCGSLERMIAPKAANMPPTTWQTDVWAPDLHRGNAAHLVHILPATRTCRNRCRRGRHRCRSCLCGQFFALKTIMCGAEEPGLRVRRAPANGRETMRAALL